MKKYFLLSLLIAFGCQRGMDYRQAMDSISDVPMKTFVKTISGDDFLGRKPFTEGETKTIAFLQKQLKSIGFSPAFGDSYLQEVPLIKIQTNVETPVSISFPKGGETLHFSSPEQIAVSSPFPSEQVAISNAEMVFCGFGIVAPEYGWNDYKGIDMKGKIAIVLINDPGLYVTPTNSDCFKGRELTYYGRWTYKFEEAARQGAAGVLIIHEDLGAGYNWGVASRSAKMGAMHIDDASLNANCRITGWMESSVADAVFAKIGHSVADLRKQACQSGFSPFEMGGRLSVSVSNTLTQNVSYNVAGILPGAKKADEAVALTAHWDHFGVVPGTADSIYNGAVDNGTTMAWALEISRAMASLSKRCDRSVLLLFPTSEEDGLLGTKYYVSHPAIPMSKTVVCLNNDMMQPRGRMRDLMLIGYGYNSELDSLYASLAREQDRYITPDPNAHTGMFFRSDHYAFHAAGVPAIWAMGCYDSREKGKEWAATSWQLFLDEVYHTPLDNYDENWDWGGIVEDAKIGFAAAFYYANK